MVAQRLGWGLALLVGSLTACSSDETGAGGSGGTGATSATGGAGAVGGTGGSGTGAGSVGGQAAGGSAPLTDPNECANPEDEWVFCCDFEQDDLSMWDDYDGNPDETNHLMADPGPFDLEGNQVVRIRVPAGRGGADLVKVLDPDGGGYDRLYARWYQYWEPGYDFDAPNHGSGLHAGSRDLLGQSGIRPDGTNRFFSGLEPTTDTHIIDAYTYYRGMYQDCVDPNGSCWGDHFPCTIDEGYYCEKEQHRETVMPPTLEAGRWYCLEMMMDGGTPTSDEASADGVLDWWIDGRQIGPWTDLWLRTDANLRLTILWLSLFHHEEHSVEGLYWDHVVVSTERIGCP